MLRIEYEKGKTWKNTKAYKPISYSGLVVIFKTRLMQAAPDAVFSTAVTSLKPEDAHDPNRVKCVVDNHGYAIYFSRGLIPFNKLVILRQNSICSPENILLSVLKNIETYVIITSAGPGMSTLIFHICFIWGFRY